MPLTDTMIEEAAERYKREIDRYQKLSELVFQKCLDIVQKQLTIRATVQRRVKTPNSFKEKLKKQENRLKYNSVDEIFTQISDLAGVRILTYLESDREAVVNEITKIFIGKGESKMPEIDLKDKEGAGKHYRATHCQIYLPEEYLDGANDNLKGTTCEIQVCSLLAHVFNEIEHDLQYKPLNGDISANEKELLDQLGLLTKAGDITIKSLLDAADFRLKDSSGEFADVHDFVVRVRDLLMLDHKFSKNAGQLYDELSHLKINTPEKIKQQLEILKDDKIDPEILSEFSSLKKYASEKEYDFELEEGTSDILLIALLNKHCPTIIANHPTGRGYGRPSRLANIARAYNAMKS
jgi:ppGpp synthetase/RelA/SpoT-type nucleotidyltranferase